MIPAAEIVYVLSTLTSLGCALMLLRGYFRYRQRLLLWSGLCFVGFTITNVILFLDRVLIPHIDFSLWRGFAALIGLMVLLYGLIWETS